MLALVLSSLVVAAAPSIAVQTGPIADEQTRQLRGWLVQRLLEEGISVSPEVATASAVVRISRQGSALVLETQGRNYTIEAGPDAVMRLELLQRARLAAEEPETTTALSTQKTIAIQRDGEPPAGLEGTVEARLLEAGYRLAPESETATAAARVCLDYSSRGRVAATVGAGDEGCLYAVETTDPVDLRNDTGLEQLVEAVGRLTGGNRFDAQEELGITAAAAALVPVERRERIDHATVNRSKRLPWTKSEAELRLNVDGGIVGRGGGIDGSMRMSTRVGLDPGPGGLLEVLIVPSRGGTYKTIDTILAAGPDLHFRMGRRFGAGFGVVVGTRIHSYRNDIDAGGRADWYAAVPATAWLKFDRRVNVFLNVEGAMTGAPLSHSSGEDVQWSRTAWSVRTALGVSFGWGIL